MPRRKMNRSDSRRLDGEDNPIGLTGAFAPVKGPQSVDYDTEDDPVGLTQAFGAVVVDEDERPWSEEGKWRNFDWDEAVQGEDEEGDSIFTDEDQFEEGEDAVIEALDEEVEGFLDDEDAQLNREESPAKAAAAAKRSRKESAGAGAASGQGPKHGRHAAPEPEVTPRMRKSQRTRRVLIVLVVLLVLVIGVLGFFVFRTVSDSQHEAAQQAQEQVTTPRESTIIDAPAGDAVDSTTRLADVPDLAQLLGMTQDEAIAAIGRGALVTSNREVNEEGNPIRVSLNVALTEEAADSKTGTPTVYLDLGEDGRVRQAGYSASASALGFGALSFGDAVSNEHVIEKTLAKTGINVPEGSAVLPPNKEEYTTYGGDGTTVMRERCSFEGDTEVRGIPCVWSSILSYDYTTQVVTGNLTDTVRIIYVYISMK